MILAQRLFGIWLLARSLPYLSEVLYAERDIYRWLPGRSAILVVSALIPVVVGTYLWLRSRSIGRPTGDEADHPAGYPRQALHCGIILIGVWQATRGAANVVAQFSAFYEEPSGLLGGPDGRVWTPSERVTMAYAVVQLLLGLTLIRSRARIAARLGFAANAAPATSGGLAR